MLCTKRRNPKRRRACELLRSFVRGARVLVVRRKQRDSMKRNVRLFKDKDDKVKRTGRKKKRKNERRNRADRTSKECIIFQTRAPWGTEQSFFQPPR